MLSYNVDEGTYRFAGRLPQPAGSGNWVTVIEDFPNADAAQRFLYSRVGAPAPRVGVLGGGAQEGAVAVLPSGNEAAIRNLVADHLGNNPGRQVGVFRNTESGTTVMVQGDDSRAVVPSRSALETALGPNHTLLRGSDWTPDCWEELSLATD